MGGINTNRGPKPTITDTSRGIHHELTTATQEFTLHLMRGAQYFFEMHGELEAAVLAEGQRSKSVSIQVSTVSALSGKASGTLVEAKNVLNNHKEMVKKEGTWHAPYFELMLRKIDEQLVIANKLTRVITDNKVLEAAQKGELQSSLWNENTNSDVRTLSIEFTRKLGALLSAHADFVEITNSNSEFI